MAGKFDHDRSSDMERLLAQTMRAGMAPPTAECLDAERLAAWSDGALSAIEGFDVEQHLSTCERCQAMLAAFVRITGAEPEVAIVLPFWRRRAVRWIVPIAAAAAGVIWFVMPHLMSGPVPATQIARVEEMRSPVGDPTSTLSAPSGVPDNTTKVQDMAATRQPRGQRDSATASKAAGAITPGRSGEPSRNVAGQREDASSTPSAIKPVPAPPVAVAATSAAAPIESSQAVTVTAEVTPVQTGNSSRTAARSTPALMARPANGVIEIVPRSMAASSAARAQADATAGVVRESTESTVRTRWRIRPNGTVVRILGDAGTPEPVTLSPPAPVTAGDAASPSECWLVGAAGAVWRSTDGLHFDRVTTPVDADLRAIAATSTRQAAVTTNDGRRFVTTDAGVTWRSLP